MSSISLPPRLMPPRGYLAVIRTIDKFTEWTGYLFVLFIIPLILSNVIEVFARYVLKDPTIWALDITTMSYAALFMLGSALALLKGAHVRTDIFWDGFSERKKGLIDLWSYLILFYPTMVIFFIISADDAWYAYVLSERSEQTPWRPLLWPFRAAVPMMALLMMIQGISEVLKCWYQIKTGSEFQHREKIEV